MNGQLSAILGAPSAQAVVHPTVFFEAAEAARCIAEDRTESPLRPVGDSIVTLRVMDEMRAGVQRRTVTSGIRRTAVDQAGCAGTVAPSRAGGTMAGYASLDRRLPQDARRDRSGVAERSWRTPTPDAWASELAPVPVGGLIHPDVLPASRRGGTIRRSFMRGDKPQVRIEVAAAPPTTVSLLLARYEAIIEAEDLVKPGDLTQRAVALLKAAVPRVVSADPLRVAPSVDDLTINAIHDWQDSNLVLSSFIDEGIYGKVVSFLIADNQDFDEAQVRGRIRHFLLPYVVQAELAMYSSVNTLRNAEVRQAVAGTIGHNPNHLDSLNVAAERYLLGNARARLADPDGPTKNQLISALESMPTVQAIYRGEVWDEGPIGGGLVLTHTEKAFQQKHFMQYYERFLANATQALKRVYGMVEPGRLPPVDQLKTVEVNPDEVTARYLRSPEIKAFRADADRQNDKVRASVMADVPTVVHELGHHVEFALPIAVWLDIIQTLQDRAGGRPMIDIYGNGKEIAFDAAMPAFREIYRDQPGAQSSPKYAAKIYESGDTEIISMSMEMFSQPLKARMLVRSDPMLAATVLRAIRPNEFRASVPPPLRALLPRGDV